VHDVMRDIGIADHGAILETRLTVVARALFDLP